MRMSAVGRRVSIGIMLSVSFDQPTITSWLDRARPYLTASAHAGLVQAAVGAHAGYLYSQMHQNSWKLATTVNCAVDQAAPTPTPTMTTLTCTVIDDTVTQAGVSVPDSAVPNPWPYNTTQPPAILVMELVGPTWLVGADRQGSDCPVDSVRITAPGPGRPPVRMTCW